MIPKRSYKLDVTTHGQRLIGSSMISIMMLMSSEYSSSLGFLSFDIYIYIYIYVNSFNST